MLALIARVESLPDAGSWPDDVRSTLPAVANILRLRARAASPQRQDVPT